MIDGHIEVNESLLTGEADAIFKQNGDTLLSVVMLLQVRQFVM